MSFTSIYDGSIAKQVESWVASSGELLVEPYYPHSGSSGDFYFVTSIADLNEMISQARSGAIFYIYRHQQFPVRGIVDDTFINKTVGEFPDGEWYIIVPFDFYPVRLTYLGAGNTRTELRTELEEYRGMFVCVGIDPSTLQAQYIRDGDLIVANKP